MGNVMDIFLNNSPNASTQLNAILQAFPDLLFTIDESGIILDYKAGDAASMLFAPPEVFIGQKVEDALPRELAESMSAMTRALYDLAAGPLLCGRPGRHPAQTSRR